MSETVSSIAMPLVSFIVPCYNYGRFVGECIASILAQKGEFQYEIIAIDDASSDTTLAVLRSFDDPRIQIISHPVNQGHVRTVNEGINLARGELIARIDPDDRYRPEFLEATIPIFHSHLEVGLVYGNAAIIDERGVITMESSDHVHGGRDYQGCELLPLLERNFICAPTTIARREAWLQAMPVPDGLAFNDWYLTVMMARHYEFYYVNRVLADYRVHAANHHVNIVRDKSEELSIIRVLDTVFNTPERTNELERKKRRARGRIYGAQYVTLADKYFGFGMRGDARRCYVHALRYRPAYCACPPIMRRLLATVIGRPAYDRVKLAIKSLGLGGVATGPRI